MAVIMLLSAVGMGETVYLIRKRIRMEKPVCIIGDGCVTVLESKYNKLFLVPNDIMGFLTYVAIFILTIAYLYHLLNEPILVLCISLLVAVGCAASIMFIFIQWRLIKAWCFWCVTSAFTLITMGIILIVRGF